MPSPRPHILLVDDDPTIIGVLGNLLQEHAHLRFAVNGHDALRLAAQKTPDLVLLDLDMPGMSGFDVCKVMKDMPALADVPVIVITGQDNAEHEVTALQIGAADFVCKPLRAARVLARVQVHLKMKRLNDALRNAAMIDALTQVANRRYFDEALDREWRRAQRAGTALSLLMIDVDAFKRYNDHYGHQKGDECLRGVARALSDALRRPGDLVARYGGEEFAVLLPDTDGTGARCVAVDLLQAVENLAMPHADSPASRYVTISIGVSTCDGNGDSWVGRPSAFMTMDPKPPGTRLLLLAAADRALYAAKSAGRNQARFVDMDDMDDLEEPASSHDYPPLRRVS